MTMLHPMHNDLTNLLPLERRRILSRNYFLRLGVIIVVCATILVLVSMVLLLPTYILLTENIRAKESRLTTIESSLSSADEEILSMRFVTLSESTVTLSALAEGPSASVTIRSLLALARPGITLTHFGYVPGNKKKLSALTISGVAATRDALRTYQLALENSSLTRSADLPVSAYAKDSDITFTIIVTLVP